MSSALAKRVLCKNIKMLLCQAKDDVELTHASTVIQPVSCKNPFQALSPNYIWSGSVLMTQKILEDYTFLTSYVKTVAGP